MFREVFHTKRCQKEHKYRVNDTVEIEHKCHILALIQILNNTVILQQTSLDYLVVSHMFSHVVICIVLTELIEACSRLTSCAYHNHLANKISDYHYQK